MPTKKGKTINIGDQIVYSTLHGKTKSGIVVEVFPSLDGSVLCLWVEGEDELITEYKLIEEDSDETGDEPKSVWYAYEVNVGSGCATGSVLVSENATDDEIQLAIMNDLCEASYRKQEPPQNTNGEPESVWYDYEVNVGNGCGTGSVLVPVNAADDEIRLTIMNDLYEVSYRRQGPLKED